MSWEYWNWEGDCWREKLLNFRLLLEKPRIKSICAHMILHHPEGIRAFDVLLLLLDNRRETSKSSPMCLCAANKSKSANIWSPAKEPRVEWIVVAFLAVQNIPAVHQQDIAKKLCLLSIDYLNHQVHLSPWPPNGEANTISPCTIRAIAMCKIFCIFWIEMGGTCGEGIPPINFEGNWMNRWE